MSAFFRLESPYRGEYRLHRLSFGQGGPVTALVAGVHGDEVNGIYSLNLIAAMLRLQRVSGTVHLLPCVNLFGAESSRKRWPFDDRDLNEAFPGAANGSPAERIALAVLEASEADLCIEVQTGSAANHEVPHARVPLEGAATELGRVAGLPVLWRRPDAHIDDGLVGAWRAAGRTALELRAGRGGALDLDDARTLARGLVRVLAAAGHINSVEGPTDSRSCSTVLDHRASVGGFFVPEVRVGETVTTGQLLGVLRAPLGGDPLEAVHAHGDGIVLALRVYPVVHANERVVRVACPED
jgi:predicted deacylase